jgi:hypothetical protein
MRLAFTASALCLSILVFAAQQATSQSPAPSTDTHASSTTAAAGDAAEKHAQRTACLKEARARKLLNAEKTSFLKDCIAAPPEAISANRISPQDRP